MLLVAVTPSGDVPMISPTSLPPLASECTQQPTSSSSGWSSTPLIAAVPTDPVAHWMTRRLMLHTSPSVASAGPQSRASTTQYPCSAYRDRMAFLSYLPTLVRGISSTNVHRSGNHQRTTLSARHVRRC